MTSSDNLPEVQEVTAAMATAEMPACDAYSKCFRASAAATSGPAQAAWEELFLITALYPGFDESDEPLLGIASLERISDERIAAWAELADQTGDADLIARCSDLYWLRRQHAKRERKDIERARVAIDAYVRSAASLGAAGHWLECFTRFQRALRLARMVNEKAGREAATSAMLDLLRGTAGDGASFGPLRLISLLRREGVDCAPECIAWCETAAANSEAEGAASGDYMAHDRACSYLEEKIAWFRPDEDKAVILETWKRIAENHRAMASIFDAASASFEGYKLTAAHWMEQSVETLRKAGAPADEIKAAHQRLLELQAEGVKSFRRTEERTIDLTKMAESAISLVEGVAYPHSLLALATCAEIPTAHRIRTVTERERGIAAHIPVAVVSRSGKPTATRRALADGDPDAVESEMVTRTRTIQQAIAQAAVLPARRAFLASCPIGLEDLRNLSRGSSFVPHGREEAFARGLYAGFSDDWIVAAHLLPPQIENSLREFFAINGAVVSGLHRSRQHENDLNKLLAMPEAVTLLGSTLRLDLSASLAHGFGSNVRNLMAHGLLEDRDYDSLEMVYAWWLSLRLVLLFRIVVESSRAKDAAQQSPAGTAPDAPQHPGAEPTTEPDEPAAGAAVEHATFESPPMPRPASKEAGD